MLSNLKFWLDSIFRFSFSNIKVLFCFFFFPVVKISAEPEASALTGIRAALWRPADKLTSVESEMSVFNSLERLRSWGNAHLVHLVHLVRLVRLVHLVHLSPNAAADADVPARFLLPFFFCGSASQRRPSKTSLR